MAREDHKQINTACCECSQDCLIQWSVQKGTRLEQIRNLLAGFLSYLHALEQDRCKKNKASSQQLKTDNSTKNSWIRNDENRLLGS